jgi:hypothetical protein
MVVVMAVQIILIMFNFVTAAVAPAVTQAMAVTVATAHLMDQGLLVLQAPEVAAVEVWEEATPAALAVPAEVE